VKSDSGLKVRIGLGQTQAIQNGPPEPSLKVAGDTMSWISAADPKTLRDQRERLESVEEDGVGPQLIASIRTADPRKGSLLQRGTTRRASAFNQVVR